MRFVRSFLALSSIAITSLALLSSCVVPIASSDQNCVSYCTLLQGCGTTGAPTADCNTWCDAFAETLDHVGCKDVFDSAAACAVGDGTCQAESCTAQTDAFTACTTDFCASNPDDAACTGS